MQNWKWGRGTINYHHSCIIHENLAKKVLLQCPWPTVSRANLHVQTNYPPQISPYKTIIDHELENFSSIILTTTILVHPITAIPNPKILLKASKCPKNFNTLSTLHKQPHFVSIKLQWNSHIKFVIFHHINDFKLPFLLICVLYVLSFKHVCITHSSIRLHLHFITCKLQCLFCFLAFLPFPRRSQLTYHHHYLFV